MEYRRLQLFLALADELHFRRAATRCNVTPSVLSEQLKRLEDELGGQLFVRTTRSVALSAFGKAFRSEARAALDRLSQAKLAARHFAAGGNRTVRVSFTPAFQSELPLALAAFRAAYPETKLFVQELGTVDAESALGRHEIDVALLHPPLDRSDLTLYPLQQKPLQAVYDPRVFDLGDAAKLDRVLAHPLIWHPHHRAPRLTAALFARAEECKRLPRIVAEAGTWAAAQVMAAGGIGIAMLPNGMVGGAHGNIAVSDIDMQPLTLECAVASRSDEIDDPILLELSRLLAEADNAPHTKSL